MPVALVSGSEPDLVAAALERLGFTVITADAADKVAAAVEGIAPGSLTSYVQLPVRLGIRGESAVTVIRNFLTEGLLARFDTAQAALPALAERACVVLVAGNHPASTAVPDDAAARLALLRVLGRCLLVESGGSLMVKIADHQHTPETIAALVSAPAEAQLQIFEDLSAPEETPSLPYVDWRQLLLELDATES